MTLSVHAEHRISGEPRATNEILLRAAFFGDYEPWNPTAPVDWTLFAPYPHPLNSWTHTDQKTWTLGRDLRIRSAPFHGLLTLVAYALSARSDAGMQDVIRGIFQ